MVKGYNDLKADSIFPNIFKNGFKIFNIFKGKSVMISTHFKFRLNTNAWFSAVSPKCSSEYTKFSARKIPLNFQVKMTKSYKQLLYLIYVFFYIILLYITFLSKINTEKLTSKNYKIEENQYCKMSVRK